MRRVLVIVSVLLLVTLTSAAIIDELRALKQALSPKEPSYVQAEEKTKVTWNPAANCLEVNNIAGGWRKVRPAEIHDALVAEAAHFWQAVGAAPATPRGKQNLAHHLKGAPGKRFRDNVNPGNNWPLNFNNVYFPVTYPQLIRIAQAHPAYQNGGFVYGDSDFVRCGQWLMAIDSTSGPPRWYALPVAGIAGHHPAGVIQQGMQDSYAGMFDGATAGLGHEPVIADIRAVILNNVNNYDVHMCGLVYAQTIGEVRRNHITAIINPLIYDLINNVANYTPTSVLRGGKAAAGCKHPMARADSLAQVGAGVPPDGVGDNAVNYAPPLGGRAGTAAFELENEALVRWLTTVHAGNYRVAADCVNHAPAHVDAAKNAIRATIRGRVHVNMGNL